MTTPAYEPILWVVRYALEPLDPRNPAGEPELAVARIPDPLNSTADEHAVHEAITAPPTATGVFLADQSGAGVAFLTVAQLQPHVDPDRPILLMQASSVTARPARSWPMYFTNVDDTDPMIGVEVHIDTDEPGVRMAWIEGHLLGSGQITVADLIGE